MTTENSINSLTDDGLEGFARLHGCEFWTFPAAPSDACWFVNGVSPARNIHPVECEQAQRTGSYGFRSKRELALAYLEHHGLLPEGTCSKQS